MRVSGYGTHRTVSVTTEKLSEDDLTLVERPFGESFVPCPFVPLLLTIFSFDRGRHGRA